MIERILKHMNIYREMKNAAIPLKLIGKKGEDSCMNAARLVNQQELSSLMELLRKNGDWLINLDRSSLILDEEVYKRCLNLNTLNEQNLRDCEYMVVPWRKSEESLFSKPRVFEELKVLYKACT